MRSQICRVAISSIGRRSSSGLTAITSEGWVIIALSAMLDCRRIVLSISEKGGGLVIMS